MRARPRLAGGMLAGWLAAAATALAADDAWPKLAPSFHPPEAYAGKFGAYASPLRFTDGRTVAAAADWPARRAEILRYWHGEMGPWPELLARPKVEVVETGQRDGIAQWKLQIEVAPGVMQKAFLLVPPGGGPRPAVLVPFYAPETSIDYRGPMAGQAAQFAKDGRGAERDFALQLARRGFVTLAIGSPGDDARRPPLHGARCQPLSYLAYIAANCHTILAQRPEVDARRIGVMGHSYGGKWAMFASCLYEKFACAVWSDGGVVFDEARPAVNYWEPWYLGLDAAVTRKPGVLSPESPRTGAYKRVFEAGHDLHELHALMAPRPFLVSGGSEDPPARWFPLNHAVAVNRLLGYEQRVALTSRAAHAPTAESNAQAFAFLGHFLGPVPPAAGAEPIARYTCEVVATWPHDRRAFTQGLVVRHGLFLESTGLNGRSSLRVVEPATGRVLLQIPVAAEYFAEGLAVLGARAYQLTWQHHKGFVYDADTFRLEREFAYDGEGWGLTTDGRSLILSDGTPRLRFLDPATFRVERTIEVRADGQPVEDLNELEWVRGEIFANVWQTDEIVRIDPATGRVRGVIDCTGLLAPSDRRPDTDVLNGIAYDEATDRLFLTGKLWPKIFEVRVLAAPKPKN